jgi:hypothetical protein
MALAKLFSIVGLAALPVVLGYGLVWGFAMRNRWPRFSGSIRRGFWIMALFGGAVTLPSSLPLSLFLVNLLLLALGVTFYASDFAPALRRYGRIQCWAAILCMTDWAILWNAGLLESPQTMGYAAAHTALLAVCLQLFVVGIGVWLSIMLPLIAEMRAAQQS